MTLSQLLKSGLIIEIMGEKEQDAPALYKAAGISRQGWSRWKKKADADNPKGMYKRFREQLDQAREIRKGKALKQIRKFAKEVKITKTRTDANGKVVKTVIKRPDVNAAIYLLQARFPELNIKAAMSKDAIEKEVQARLAQLATVPQLPVIPVERSDAAPEASTGAAESIPEESKGDKAAEAVV